MLSYCTIILLSTYRVIYGCMPMIVAVLGEKGGTGKTTLATNLAGMRAAEGRDVLIIDADRQGSASYWAEKRSVSWPMRTAYGAFARCPNWLLAQTWP
jgi:ABC-type Na+ transport system ATPase subunit NatA